MSGKEGLLSGALRRVRYNKRYIFWFYVLNAALAWLGTGAFENQAHAILDHSLRSERLLHGFDVGVLIELIARPEYGPAAASAGPAIYFALLFFLLTMLFMPGVLEGYASTYRLPREEFFRACGRNLWRFIRLSVIAGIVMGAVAGALFSVHFALLKQAAESTNELLPFYVSVISACVIFLVMTALRIGFDLSEADIVLSDQRLVRKSIRRAFRHEWSRFGRLLGAYILIAIFGIAILLSGILIWIKFVSPTNLVAAAAISQFTLLLLLVPRFWQRSIAVTYYLQHMVEPIAERPFTPAPVAPTVEPAASNMLSAPSVPAAP
jgi:hypothetical protein